MYDTVYIFFNTTDSFIWKHVRDKLNQYLNYMDRYVSLSADHNDTLSGIEAHSTYI